MDAGTSQSGSFPADNVALSERWARTRFTDLRYYGTPAWGGHFAAYEAPSEFVTEVRAGLRALASVSISA
jgi:epoxide hydrolase